MQESLAANPVRLRPKLSPIAGLAVPGKLCLPLSVLVSECRWQQRSCPRALSLDTRCFFSMPQQQATQLAEMR